MWETLIAGAGGLLSLYVAVRREIRRSYELLQKDIGHLQGDTGRLDRSLTDLTGRLDRSLTDLTGRLDRSLTELSGRLERGLTDVRADIRRLDQKIDAVRGELIGFLGPR